MSRPARTPTPLSAALERIRADRRRGASSLARAALAALADVRPRRGDGATEYRRAVRRAARRLQRVRPAMVPVGAAVAGAMTRWAATVGGRRDLDAAALHAALRAACRGEADAMRRARADVAGRFAVLGAGRPATLSTSAMVIEALVRAVPRRVVVFESRPALEGRATARALARAGIPVRVTIDARMPAELERCDAVVLGCDAVLPDGSVVAKAGARALAELATRRRLPVYVLADRWRVASPGVWRPESPVAAEVWAGAPAGVDVVNVLFEVVSARAVRRIVTESGAFAPATAARRLRAARRSGSGGKRAGGSRP